MLLLEVVSDGVSDRHKSWKHALFTSVVVVFIFKTINGNAVLRSFALDSMPGCVRLRTEDKHPFVRILRIVVTCHHLANICDLLLTGVSRALVA